MVPPAAVLIVSVLLVAYFALAAVPWLLRAIGSGRRVNDRAAASHAAMSAGLWRIWTIDRSLDVPTRQPAGSLDATTKNRSA